MQVRIHLGRAPQVPDSCFTDRASFGGAGPIARAAGATPRGLQADPAPAASWRTPSSRQGFGSQGNASRRVPSQRGFKVRTRIDKNLSEVQSQPHFHAETSAALGFQVADPVPPCPGAPEPDRASCAASINVPLLRLQSSDGRFANVSRDRARVGAPLQAQKWHARGRVASHLVASGSWSCPSGCLIRWDFHPSKIRIWPEAGPKHDTLSPRAAVTVSPCPYEYKTSIEDGRSRAVEAKRKYVRFLRWKWHMWRLPAEQKRKAFDGVSRSEFSS